MKAALISFESTGERALGSADGSGLVIGTGETLTRDANGPSDRKNDPH